MADDALAVSELIQRMSVQATNIAALEAACASEEGREERKHHLPQQRLSSWLASATNPIWHLLGRVTRRPTREMTQAQAQDDHLARLAASVLLPPLQARMALPNRVLAVVVGIGRLGSKIAGELLRRGCSVRLVTHDCEPHGGRDGLAKLVDDIRENIHQGTLMPSDLQALMSRCSLVPSLFEAIEDLGCMVWVIEAVAENLPLKRSVVHEAASTCAAKGIPPHRVLFSSNTITYIALRIAHCAHRARSCCVPFSCSLSVSR